MLTLEKLPPKVQIIYLQGYKRALEDLGDKINELAAKVEKRIEGIKRGTNAEEFHHNGFMEPGKGEVK